MALSTVQFKRANNFVYGNQVKPIHVVTGDHSERWETACKVNLLARIGRLERGNNIRKVTCGECRTWLGERGLA